jgi:cbb3-type cytochrome oxidase subunit 3
MSDWLTQTNYSMMVLQVIVTLVLVPILSYRLLLSTANNYGISRFPNASDDVKLWLKRASRQYWSVVAISLLIAGGIVLNAIFNNSELLNWDDQSGLMFIYLLAMIPVIIMALLHKALFGVFKKHAGNKRSAFLKVRTLQEYISKPLVALVISANIVFVATVLYFKQQPFDGFAGLYNLIGLVVINLIFIAVIFAVYRDNKTNALQQPEKRNALKKRSININLLILALALFHLSLSMWVQGSDLVTYKVLLQSVYFQVILVISAFSLTLPKSMFLVEKK